MKKGQLRNMTEGSLWRGIFFFSIPLVASNLLETLFNMSDIAVVGNFAPDGRGPMALGAVGSTTILVALFSGLLLGIGSGVNVLVARYYGAKDDKAVKETVNASGLVCLAGGILVMLVGVIFGRDILALLNTKDDLIDGATLYLRLYFLGMPAVAVFSFGSGVLSAVGDTRHPLYYLTFAGILNVALNLFFVIVIGMDVAGVALASTIAHYVSATLVLVHLGRQKGSFAFSFRGYSVDFGKVKQVIALGLPAGMQNAIFQLANLFIQRSVNSFDTLLVEGNSAATNADALVYGVMDAFYIGCASFIGQNFGAGKRDRMRKAYLISLVYSFGFALVIGVSLVVFGRNFLMLFTRESAVAEAGMKRLTIMGLSYAFSAFMDNTIAASRGIGKTGVPTFIVIMGSCVFRVIWVYTVFAYFHTIPSLYLLYIFSWTITAVAEIIYFVRSFRRLPICSTEKNG